MNKKWMVALMLSASAAVAWAQNSPLDIVKSVQATNQVEFKTTLGDFTIEVYPDNAPKTVQNFLQYVKSGYYNGTIFHRVIGNFMVQGGGFTSDMIHKDTRAPIPLEANNGLRNDRGSVAMARTSDPNSATSQFFINLADNNSLNGTSVIKGTGYAVFGKVIAGMATIEKIRNVPTKNEGKFQDVPATPIVILSATSDAPLTIEQATVAPAQTIEVTKIPDDGKRGKIVSEVKQIIPSSFKRLGRLTVNGKWAIVNEDGRLISPPIWDEVRLDERPFIAVRRANKWGFVSRLDGKLIIPVQYKEVESGDGFVILKDDSNKMELRDSTDSKILVKGGVWDVIEETGKKDTYVVGIDRGDNDQWFLNKQWFLLLRDKKLGPFQRIDCVEKDAPAFIVRDEGRYYYLRFDGKPLNDQIYSSAGCFSKKYKVATANKKDNSTSVLIDSLGGEMLLQVKISSNLSALFDHFGGYTDKTQDGTNIIIKYDGTIIPVRLSEDFIKFEARSHGNDWIIYRDKPQGEGGRMLISNFQGELVANESDLARYKIKEISGNGFRCGHAFAQKTNGNLWGIIDTSFNWVVEPKYYGYSVFSDFRYQGCSALVQVSKGQYQLLDVKGQPGLREVLDEWQDNQGNKVVLKAKGITVASVSDECDTKSIQNADGKSIWRPSDFAEKCKEQQIRQSREASQAARERSSTPKGITSVYVTADCVTGGYCICSDLRLTGGPGELSSGSTCSGYLSGFGRSVAGSYDFSVRFKQSNGVQICSGRIGVTGARENLRIKLYPDCRDAGTYSN